MELQVKALSLLSLQIFWIGAGIYLIGHYLFFHFRFIGYRQKQPGGEKKPVSVIICARNEEDSLRINLPYILRQDYPEFEVLVIDDASNDGTAELLDGLQQKFSHLKILRIDPEDPGALLPGKKEALRRAYRHAKHDWLLLTDADCRPASRQWLLFMSRHLATKTIVLGYAPLQTRSGILGSIAGWESFQTAQQYLSFALAGLPYMGVGRNLAYRREMLDEQDPFRSHAQLASGDDDLLMREHATRHNVATELSSASFVHSHAPDTWARWWRQKLRHLTTARYYRWHILLLLGVYGLAQCLFYLLLPLVFMDSFRELMLGILVLKLLLQFVSLWQASRWLGKAHLLWLFPLWEFLTTLLLSLVHLRNLFFRNNRVWN